MLSDVAQLKVYSVYLAVLFNRMSDAVESASLYLLKNLNGTIMKKLSFLVFFLASLLISLSASASIFKSLDDNGKVQYTQTPPMDRPSEEIKSVTGTSQPVAPPPQTTKGESTKAIVEPENKEGTKVEIVDKKELEKYCIDLKESYRVLQEHNRTSYMKDGEVVTMPYEEKQKRMDELQQKINEYCK